MVLDYKEIGLKCGIEIHQRLKTDKLFCNCPSQLRDDKPDVIVKRELRAVAGETGEIDVAAAHETSAQKYFIYEGYSDTTCLVELDEEPPHPINKNALDIVLQVSKMLNSKIIDEVQVMRKTVVDGSNTTGFQRTALVSVNGHVETKEGHVGVPTISIEEESAKDITKGIDKNGKSFVVFRLDRLGIPLVEIGTDPDIKTPKQCRKVVEKLGMMLRSTGKVARGIGTIRQDVNVSVRGGDRIEIKGAQDLKTIETWVEYEAIRQLALIELKKEIVNKKIDLEKIKNSKPIDVTDIFKNTKCKFVNDSISKTGKIFAAKLTGFNGLIGKETSPGKRFGTEMSDYAKAKANVGGMIHSDEKLDKYKFSEKEITAVKDELNCGIDDAFIMVVDSPKKSEMAVKQALLRAARANEGVIREVRRPNQDGTSSFMRPMPGQARMYPETDIQPIKVDATNIEIPELLEDMKERFKKKYNLAEDLARDLTKKGKHDVFEKFVDEFSNIKPAFIGEVMISLPKTIQRKHKIDVDKLQYEDFEQLFTKLNKGEITKDSVDEIILVICKGDTVNYSKYKTLSDNELTCEIKRIMQKNSSIEFKILIGKVMGSLKGRAEGKKIMEILKKLNK